MGALSQWRH